MTIAKNSLIITAFLFAASLSAENKFYNEPTAAAAKFCREPLATPLQALGGILFVQGITIHGIGKKLIANDYANINLEKMPFPFKTPKSMKKFGLASLLVGVVSVASPLIFEKAAELGEQYRENNWKKKMASLESLEKTPEKEVKNS